MPTVTLKTTRRRRANSSDFDSLGISGETDRYEETMVEEKTAEDANSSDEDSRRATKRARHAQ